MKHLKKFESSEPRDITICENAQEMKDLLEGEISEVIERLKELELKYGGGSYISLYVQDWSVDPYSEVGSENHKITITRS